MAVNLRPWALDDLLAQGWEGPAWKEELDKASHKLAKLQEAIAELCCDASNPTKWQGVIDAWWEIDGIAQILESVETCERSLQRSAVPPRPDSSTCVYSIRSQELALVRLVGCLPSEGFSEILAALPQQGHGTMMQRWREHSRTLIPASSQVEYQLIESAAKSCRDQYLAEFGSLRVRLPSLGQGSATVPLGRVRGMQSRASEQVCSELHDAVVTARQGLESSCCEALSNITQARLVYAERTGLGTLHRSFLDNRVDKTSVDALWVACDRMNPQFQSYLQWKAAFMGKDRLDWWDLVSRNTVGRQSSELIPWQKAKRQVVDAFRSFDNEMADFAVAVLAKGWVHHKPVDAKRVGAFCVSVAPLRQSRIMLSFRGLPRDVMTLAHELGHAYHSDQLALVSPGMRNVTRALAETSSNFCESLVRTVVAENPMDRAIQTVEAAFSKCVLQRIVYDFEISLLEMRSRGPLTPNRLNERMGLIQRHYLGDTVTTLSVNNWVAMRRLFDVDGGFYNWQHSFGALFSAAVHRHFLNPRSGTNRADFRELLQSTGIVSAELVAAQTLNAALSGPGFWSEAFTDVRKCIDDIVCCTDGADLRRGP